MAVTPAGSHTSSVLVVNAYALGNHGDAAIVEGLIAVGRHAGATEITVAPSTSQKGAAGWIALGADAVAPPLLSTIEAPGWARRARIFMLIHVLTRLARMAVRIRQPSTFDATAKAYRDATLVIAVGGSYLGGTRPGMNLVHVMNIVFARLARRPVIVAPMTINPPSWLVGRMLSWALRDAVVFVRDEPSGSRLGDLGVSSQLAPDLALRAPSVRASLRRLRTGARSASEHEDAYLGWAPRIYRPDHDVWDHRDEIERRLVAAVAMFMRRTGFRLLFIPQVVVGREDDDRAAINRLDRQLPDDLRSRVDHAPPAGSVSEAIDQFGGCRLLIASRLHASLLAMAAAVPSLSVAYEPKVYGVLDGLGLADRVISPDPSWSAVEIADRLAALLEPMERERTIEALAIQEGKFGAFEEAIRRGLQSRARPGTRATLTAE